MLVTKLNCPKCKTVLRPAKPLPAGKKVKCPKCANDFTAEEGDADKQLAKGKTEPAAPKKPPAKAAAKPAPKKAEAKAAPVKPTDDDDDDGPATYGIVAADRPKTQEDLDREEEEGVDDDENKVNFVPDHSIKDLRGPAQIAVIKPSNMLILNGVVGFFGWAILFIILIIPVVFPVLEDDVDKDAAPPPVQAQGAKKEPKKASLMMVGSLDVNDVAKLKWYFFALSLTPIFIGIAYTCVMTYGAVQMQNLESRAWGFIASGMCIFPYATGGFVLVCSMVITLVVFGMTDDRAATWMCVIAFASLEALLCMAIGVLGIVTLNRQDVIDGFNYVPDA